MKGKKLSRKGVSLKTKEFFIIGGVIFLVALIGGGLFYRHEHKTATISTYSSKLTPTQKQPIANSEQSVQQAREKLRPTKIPLSVLRTLFHTTPEPLPQAGIFATHQGPFEPITFIINNAWQGPVGNNWEIVFAGGVPQNPQRGSSLPVFAVVRVYKRERTPYGLGSLIGNFVVPDKSSSSLTITSVTGTIMQLKANSGQSYSFNLETNKYQ